MNVKKIIREEMDDFDWIRDVPPLDLTKGKWVIKNNNPNSVEENRKIQEFLYSIGYRWTYGLEIEDMVADTTLYYFDDTDPFDNSDAGKKVFDVYSYETDVIQDLINEKGFKLYEWDLIKSVYNIK